MIRIESIEDDIKGVVTYEMSNGQRVCLDKRAVADIGAAALLRGMGLGHLLPAERSPVIWHGMKVGTLPADFDPPHFKSRSYFYDPRPGDFRRDGDAWTASPMLGPGDLEAVPGFEWERDA